MSAPAIEPLPTLSTAAEPAVDGVLCVGVSYRTASLDLRERLALAPAALGAALARFGCGRHDRPAGVSELVILSTCNRLELYAAAGADHAETLLALMAEITGLPEPELEPVTYALAGAAAVRHLCRTAAGLESMILGEPQILGQVANAYSTALAHGAAAHTLSALFHGAIRAGRRARHETAINRHPATVGSVAVKMVSETLSDLDRATVVVVGAGAMAESALAALYRHGVRSVCVVSRTREHAEQLGARFDGRSEPLERLEPALADADIVIAAVAAPHHVIGRETLDTVMRARPRRPLVVVDIAVPRNVEPEADSIPGLRYIDLDDVQRHVSDTLAERTLEVPRVTEIVEEEARVCMAELRELDARPLIADLRAHTEGVRRDTLARAMRYFAHLPERDRERIEAFSESLVNRLFHEPMTRLRAEAERGQCAGYAMAVRDLFQLHR